MKIRMLEVYSFEADSVEQAERMYIEDDAKFYDTVEFESVEFEEVKENKTMHEITINVEYFTELVKKAHAYDILRAKAAESYNTDYEKAIFGFEMKEQPKPAVAPEEDNF